MRFMVWSYSSIDVFEPFWHPRAEDVGPELKEQKYRTSDIIYKTEDSFNRKPEPVRELLSWL